MTTRTVLKVPAIRVAEVQALGHNGASAVLLAVRTPAGLRGRSARLPPRGRSPHEGVASHAVAPVPRLGVADSFTIP
jgi:hypothetical protein